VELEVGGKVSKKEFMTNRIEDNIMDSMIPAGSYDFEHETKDDGFLVFREIDGIYYTWPTVFFNYDTGVETLERVKLNPTDAYEEAKKRGELKEHTNMEKKYILKNLRAVNKVAKKEGI
tara:strand:+ start:127 stop:483 length:357 start_codon:yes stop_codon:yes gene_type:complete